MDEREDLVVNDGSLKKAKKMLRHDFVIYTANKYNITQKDAAQILKMAEDAIIEAVSEGYDVKFLGRIYAKFKPSIVMDRHPKTKEPYYTHPKGKLKFIPSKALLLAARDAFF